MDKTEDGKFVIWKSKGISQSMHRRCKKCGNLIEERGFHWMYCKKHRRNRNDK